MTGDPGPELAAHPLRRGRGRGVPRAPPGSLEPRPSPHTPGVPVTPASSTETTWAVPGWLRPHILKHGRDAEAQDQDFALSAFESDCEIVTKSYVSPFQSAAKFNLKALRPRWAGRLGRSHSSRDTLASLSSRDTSGPTATKGSHVCPPDSPLIPGRHFRRLEDVCASCIL